MTRAEMHIAFEAYLDKIGSSIEADIEPEEKDHWLNRAQEVFIKTRYSGNNALKKSFEEDEKRSTDLKGVLQRSVSSIFTGGNKENSSLTPLPGDFWFAVYEECSITYQCANGESQTEIVEAKPLKNDRWGRWKNNPFRKPSTTSEYKVYRDLFTDYAELVTASDITINDYRLTYIRRPENISASQDCELAETTHDEIVRIAVSMVLESLGSPRYQTIQNELNRQE